VVHGKYVNEVKFIGKEVARGRGLEN
jgi:hypothetical protein